MPADDELSADERETLELVTALTTTGDLHPLIARLHDQRCDRERARDALKVLGELDLDMLVQLALDTLISEHVSLGARELRPLG